MNLDMLFDPVFRLPFLTGLLFAALLPLLGMYLRLRNEWLAALAFAQTASAGALAAMALDWPMLAGGLAAAVLSAGIKGLPGRAGESGYAMLMLAGWGAGVLLVANHPLAEQVGHALFDGQLYFAGSEHLMAAAACLVLTVPALARLSRPLLLARFFPAFFRARGLAERPRLMAFDLLTGLAVALATMSLGVMAAFSLVFIPPMVAWRWAGSWRAGLWIAAGVGVAGYVVAFGLALVLDQPFGPICGLLLVAVGALAGIRLHARDA
ncbi:MAG: ABC transporter [Zoogloea sp.]|nr:ABC transporter [Zoogloea sp.]